MPHESSTIAVDSKTKAVFDKKGYIVKEKISQGAFGEVYRAKNLKRDEMDAVKVMDLEKVGAKGMDMKYLDREIQALIHIKHPNVLKVNDIFRAKGKLYIFMEFAPNGTLKGQMKESANGYLSETKARRWFKQCVDALCCMHVEHHMAHRDIKLENVLLDKANNAKLSDFGFAREFSLEKSLSHTYCGTQPYYAPEIVAHQPYNPFLYDVWSIGVMLFTMLNGRHPFKVSKEHRKETLTAMKEMDYNVNEDAWDDVSKRCKDLVNAMLTFKPNVRPNILAVSQHEWLN